MQTAVGLVGNTLPLPSLEPGFLKPHLCGASTGIMFCIALSGYSLTLWGLGSCQEHQVGDTLCWQLPLDEAVRLGTGQGGCLLFPNLCLSVCTKEFPQPP